MTDKKRLELLHEKAALLNERISGLANEMDRVKRKQKESSEFYGNVRYFEARARKTPKSLEEERNSELFNPTEMAKDACRGYEEEYNQLFETYQLTLKELDEVWKEERQIRERMLAYEKIKKK